MEQREKEEEKNRRVGWLVSVGIQLFLLVLFYFLIAWKAPFPPIPEYGIELGFEQSAEAVPTVQTNNQVEEPAESMEEATSTGAKEIVEDTPYEKELVEESEAPVEVVQEVSRENETVEEITTDIETTAIGESKEETGESEIVKEEESGIIDERAIYGSQVSDSSNEERASLALSGWIWDFKPKPDDDSDETGKIVYKIVVDQDGYLVKIETLTTTVSPSIERKYREAVQKLTFSKTSEYKPAPLSMGTLTFIIKTR